MTDRRAAVAAATFKEWVAYLEAIVSDDPHEVAPGNRRSAVMLLLDLLGAGIRAGAVRPLVIRNSGPSGFAHLTYRFLLAEEFDWSGTIEIAPEAGSQTPGQLIAEVETATGVIAAAAPPPGAT